MAHEVTRSARQWRLPAICDSSPKDAVPELQAYFQGTLSNGEPYYTGSHFEKIGDNEPFRFTASDIVAVSTLSVEVPSRLSIDLLLGSGGASAATHLRCIEPGADLAAEEAAALIAEGGPAWDLWELLRAHTGVGPPIASKLLARKRPHLIPSKTRSWCRL